MPRDRDSDIQIFDMAGVLIAVEHRTPELKKRIGRLYAHFLCQPGLKLKKPCLNIVVQRARGPLPETPPEPTGLMVADRPMWGHLEGDRFVVCDGRTVGWVDYSKRCAGLELHRSDAPEPARFVATHRVFPIVVSELLRLEQRYTLHGAAIASPSGGGLLVLGDSEAGKSTLVYRALSRGYSYVADDGIVLEPLDKGVAVHPFYREFTVDPRILDPDDRQRALPAERAPGFPKVLLDLADEQVVSHCRPAAILVVRRTEESRSRLEPASRTLVLEELIKQEPRLLLYPPLIEQGFQILVNLTVTSKVYILYNCGDVFDRDDILDQCLRMADGADG